MTGRAWAAMLTASVGFGTGYVATRAALEDGMEPLTLVAVRFLVAAGLLVAYLIIANDLPSNRRVWRHGAVLGLLYMATPTIWFTLAFEHVSAGFGGLLIGVIPLATAVWAHIFLTDERLNRVKVMGLLLALAGMGVMVSSGDGGILGGGDPARGALFVLVGVIAASLGYVYTRRFVVGARLADLAVPQFLAAATTAVVVAAIVEGPDLHNGISKAWFEIGYLALVATVVPFVLLMWLIRSAGASRASLLEYLVPVVGVVVGWALLDERITAPIAIGGLLILAGVWMAESLASRLGRPPGLKASEEPTAPPPHSHSRT